MWVGEYIREKPRASALYAAFAIGVVTIWKTLQARATGQYDYILTLSAALQSLAFGLLVFDTKSTVAEGLSEKSLWAFFIAHVTRLSTTFWGEGYIPEDNTSDVYLYQFLELSGVLLLGYELLKLNTVRNIHDVGQGIERWSMLIGMVCTALILGWKTKSTGHGDYFADLSWMFSVWLEAFALGPQVMLLSSKGCVDESAVHFAGFTLAASLTFAFFWLRNSRDHYTEFADYGEHGFFWAIGIASLVRVGLCGAYFYLFMRSRGKPGGRSEYEMCPHDEL
uniref:ER lumen protein-retaining receptor n=1 Tax=Alexandrium monilatum TaxID=311494 RepID=A0A7S4RX64_9DINO|mmetsp:Transcript_16273/g.49146  ORF Transcript_16273/g.49146 Transcript_16273/m.49146 type:complete len:280 (-) Transcript_16273:108-947(-)